MRDYQTKANKGGVADSINAERFGAGEFNSIAVELENAVESSDQTLAPSDGTGEVSTQLAMAHAIYGAGGAAFHKDTGAVNAYVLNPVSPKKSPPAYFDGFTITFIPGNANTGASTVNVNSIGSKSITTIDGAALSGGEINGNVTIRYNLSDDAFHIIQVGAAPLLQIFTSSGSYSKPDGLKFIEVIVIGGGGGGGGVSGDNVSYYAAAGSGGGGGASIKRIFASALSISETITIGAGGSGGAAGANNGSAGGTSSFGAHCSATGGDGGSGKNGTATPVQLAGGAPGSGSSGDIDLDGSAAETSTMLANAAAGITSGNGGNSYLSWGAPRQANLNNGNDATGYGAGGSGGTCFGTTNTYSGGDGSDGIVIIKEYF